MNKTTFEEFFRCKGLTVDWLDRVENMLSDEEKALVKKTEDQVYIDRLLSNEDKESLNIDKFL